MNDQRRTDDTYGPVRDASRRAQQVAPAFKRAMDASPAWVREAVLDYCSAIRAEAAAYRVEARTHRVRLEEITRSQPGSNPHMEQVTSEVQP